jgi:hypothetical protein
MAFDQEICEAAPPAGALLDAGDGGVCEAPSAFAPPAANPSPVDAGAAEHAFGNWGDAAALPMGSAAAVPAGVPSADEMMPDKVIDSVSRRVMRIPKGKKKPVPMMEPTVVEEDTSSSSFVNSARGDKEKFAKLDDKAGGGFRVVYTVPAGSQEMDVLVFLPPKPLQSPVSVFAFFHGFFANYSVDAINGTDPSSDNPALGAHLAESVAASGRNLIAIAPSSSNHSDVNWDKEKVNFELLLRGVLEKLKAQLHLDKLEPGEISIAGHSGGGRALGDSAETLGAYQDHVHEMTLQDAGYGFPSFHELQKWFLTGKGPKTIHVITRYEKDDELDKDSTRKVVADGRPLAVDQLIDAGGKDFDFKTEKGSKKKNADGLILEYTIHAKSKKDAKEEERKIEVLRFPRDDHFGVRNETTKNLIKNMPEDRPTYEDPTKAHKQP